ncbi:phosphoenolpyruvate--protein phosphotransferase [Nitrincola alkalilacustris]|uniref:phosphoenolpyruvate--protein phosphotransferase n=1 Tax=Nitrincola alkalilacustris TaxID=1571224 RepID=UPI00124F5E34|nr:phosphoenolpyruvate--protein phosphotransferase [Nitrincola alkalilacustris]
MSDSLLQIISPVAGRVLALSDIPDPVFSEGMVGDGCGIDPTGQEISAPVSGVISQYHRCKHALAVRHDSGIEVLIHLGLDTVTLEGKGISSLVQQGDKVIAGQPLLRFDADYLALNARSLISAIVVTNPELLTGISVVAPSLVESHQPLLQLELKSDTVINGSSALVSEDFVSEDLVSEDLVSEDLSSAMTHACGEVCIPNPLGLHARPAARLSDHVKKLGVKVTVYKGVQAANAASVVAVMGLGTVQGDRLKVEVTGIDAESALESILSAIVGGLGEVCQPVEAAPSVTAPSVIALEDEPSLLRRRVVSENQLLGVAASAGQAAGVIYRINDELPDYSRVSDDSRQELMRLKAALADQAMSFQTRIIQTEDVDQADIFSAHLSMLQDPDLLLLIEQYITDGASCEAAVDDAFKQQIQQLQKTENSLLQSRITDLVDIRHQLLQRMLGVDSATDIPDETVLLIKDLSPSLAASLDPAVIRGVITEQGGAASHAAIVMRGLGIPMLAGLGTQCHSLHNGQRVIVDGSRGVLDIDVSDSQLQTFAIMQTARQMQADRDLAQVHEPTRMRQGSLIQVAANVGCLADARQGYRLGAEGSGLVRTEFLFQSQQKAPDENQQYAAYMELLSAMPGQTLIIRTLDVGGDKPLSYLPLPKEDNPFLGERGIRVGLHRPALLRTQVRAILRAHAETGRCKIMLPMISRHEELSLSRLLIQEEAHNLGVMVCDVGVMIEVPSAAMMADQLASQADFLSIGSNDLTQYVLAMDRGHPQLATYADGLEPSVLRMIAKTTEGALFHQRWVGVCGGLASDPTAVPILLGLGVTELSVSAPALPEIRALVRRLDEKQCQELARKALDASDAEAVRALSTEFSGSLS